jgi:hypothetical protein
MTSPTRLAGPTRRRRRREWHVPRIEVILFFIGGGLFALLLLEIGTTAILQALVGLGPSLGLIVGIEAFAILANTLSWRCTMAPERRGDVPFGRLMAARVVGDALNYVIPAGAGEIPKIRLLSRHIPSASAVASVALAKLTEGIALGVFGFLGFMVAWPILVTNAASGVPMAVAALVGVGLAVACFVAMRIGLFATAARIAYRLGVRRLDDSRLARAAMSVDGEIAEFQRGRMGDVVRSTMWHLVGWLVNVVELWLACHFLGLHPSLGVVFAGEAFGALCDSALFYVPMRIGAAEGGRVLVFVLLGFSAAQGLTLGLVRRVRELAWTTIGLAIYPWLGGGRALEARVGHDREATTVNA